MGPISEFLPTQRVLQYFFEHKTVFCIYQVSRLLFFSVCFQNISDTQCTPHISAEVCRFCKKFCSGHAGDQAFHPTAREGASQTTERVSAIKNCPPDVKGLWLMIRPFVTV